MTNDDRQTDAGRNQRTNQARDGLVQLAREENDNAAWIVLQWFVTEQVEEEASVSTVVDMLKLIGDSGHGLLMADRELGQRVFTPAGAEAGGA